MEKQQRRAIRWRDAVKLWDLQGGRCFYCEHKCDAEQFEIDHLIPVCKGGSDDLSNLCLACFDCNREKGRGDWHLYRVYRQWFKLAYRDIPFGEFRTEYYSAEPYGLENVPF